MLCLLRILQVAKVHHGCEVRRSLLLVELRGLHLPCLELFIRPKLADFTTYTILCLPQLSQLEFSSLSTLALECVPINNDTSNDIPCRRCGLGATVRPALLTQ